MRGNRRRAPSEPGGMKWFLSLLIGLVLIGQTSWLMAQPVLAEAGDEPAVCAPCCSAGTGPCSPAGTICERVCSAAVLPVSASLPQTEARNIRSMPRAVRLASRLSEPDPPPPRLPRHDQTSKFFQEN